MSKDSKYPQISRRKSILPPGAILFFNLPEFKVGYNNCKTYIYTISNDEKFLHPSTIPQ